MLARWPAEVEADFQSEYGLDIGDIYRGRLGVWKAARLLEQTSPDARWRKAAGQLAMTPTELYLHDIANHSRIAAWATSFRVLKNAPKKPDLLPPPDGSQPKRRYSIHRLLDFRHRTGYTPRERGE